MPLSFANAEFQSINGKPLKDLYLNIVYKDDPLSTIGTSLEFKELLTVDYMQCHGDLNGFNVDELMKEFQLYQTATDYNEHLGYMNVIGNSIVEELKCKSYACEFIGKIETFLSFYLKQSEITWPRTVFSK